MVSSGQQFLNVTQHAILRALADASVGAASRAALAQRLGLSRSTIAHAVRGLIAFGYCEIKVGMDDRTSQVRITAIGHDAVRRGPPA